MPADNSQELFYWVDMDDNVLGSVTREEAHRDMKKIHRSVEIFITNERGEILLQKRSLKKDTSPGMWTYTASGHVTYGQSYDEAAKRELEEEVGITTKIVKVKSYYCADTNEIMSLYTGKILSDTQIKFDPYEVEKVAWIPINELSTFIKNNPVTTWAQEGLQLVGYLPN